MHQSCFASLFFFPFAFHSTHYHHQPTRLGIFCGDNNNVKAMSASSSFGQGSNDTATTPLSVEQLKTFLVEAPAMYNYRLHPGAERQILTNCYRMLWGNNTEWMQKYFFKEGLSDQDNLSALLEKYNLFRREDQTKSTVPANPDNVVVDPTDDEPEYWESQRGKQCGHLFKRGESVYRCRYVILLRNSSG